MENVIDAYQAIMAKEIRRQETTGSESATYEGLDGIQDSILRILERGEEIENPVRYMRASAKRQTKRRTYQGKTDVVSLQSLRRHDTDDNTPHIDIAFDGSETTATAMHDYIYNRLQADHGRAYAEIYDARIYRGVPYRLMIDEYRTDERESPAVTRQRIRRIEKRVLSIITARHQIADLFDMRFIVSTDPGTCKGRYVERPEPHGMVTVWDEDQIEHHKAQTPIYSVTRPLPESWVDTVCLQAVSRNM